MANKIKDRIKEVWHSLSRKSDEDAMSGIGREKIIVFLVALVLAFSLWLVVNFNREYNVDVKVPIVLGNITTDQALTEELPSEVTASVSGDGWSLMEIYQAPPEIYIDVSEQEVNLFEQIRQQMSSVPGVTVQTVEPLSLQLELEEKRSKKIPVISNVSVNFAEQYGFLEPPVLTSDSITIRGAASRIENIESWPTDSLQLDNISSSISTEVELKDPGSLITLSDGSVQFRAEVAEYTEAEITVPVETRDFPAGRSVTFSPSSVSIKYQIPLQEYADLQNGRPFSVYVTYAQIQQDTSGFVTPKLEKLSDQSHLKMRKIDPPKVAYFTIIGN